jgi:hypothetical protein
MVDRGLVNLLHFEKVRAQSEHLLQLGCRDVVEYLLA